MEKKETMQDVNLKSNLGKIKKKFVVLSGKGGVGKSTVAVNIAYGMAIKGYKVGILDVDIHGPSVAKMVGIEGKKLETISSDGRPEPIKVLENLYALSVATMLKNHDDPVIWRGPMKMNAIKQFLADISWPELDCLIVDCPPGTGDEPLSVLQILGDVEGSVIVTTPQDVALIDVRRTVRFCEQLNVNILGVVQNMAAFKCPHCGESIDIFKGNGAQTIADDYNIDVLGSIPIDSNIVASGDKGRPYIYDFGKTDGGKEFENIVDKIIDKSDK